MPLMLDLEDNLHILDVLVRNGLDVNDLRGLDTTIFCFPTKLVDVIEKIFLEFNIPLIKNNNVNPDILEVINMIKRNMGADIEIKSRRIPFHKSLVESKIKNEVIEELIYEKDYVSEYELLKEIKESAQRFNEQANGLTKEELTKILIRTSKHIK